MEGLSAKVALVTGAGSRRGIGRQIALALAQQGVKVGCLDRDAALAREAADAIALDDGQALALPADVSNEAAVEAAVDQLAAKFGPIDILVNCAGIVRFRPILTLTTDEWENTLAVNLTGAFLCAAPSPAASSPANPPAPSSTSPPSPPPSPANKKSTTASPKPASTCSPGASPWNGPLPASASTPSPQATSTPTSCRTSTFSA